MFKQIFEVVALNLKSVPERLGLSLVILVGIAGVVGVFTALFAMSRGIEATFAATGDARNVMVMRGGSQAELNSTLTLETLQIAERAAGVRRDERGEPLASGELVVIAELPRKGETLGANVTLRGVMPQGFALRSNFRMVEGTRFTPGKHARQASPYRHLLKPKSGGVAYVLEAMGDGLHGIVDVTIAYPGGIPTLVDLMAGRVSAVYVSVRQRPLPVQILDGGEGDDRARRARFQRWINALWQEKDAELSRVLDKNDGQR